MDAPRHGQRLLMMLASQDTTSIEQDDYYSGIYVMIVGLLCLVIVATMCACQERKQSNNDVDATQQSRTGDDNTGGNAELEDGDASNKGIGNGGISNGGISVDGGPSRDSDHKRQASTCSGPPGLRPTSLRELPEPPGPSTKGGTGRHTRHTSMSGVELPPVPDDAVAGAVGGLGGSGDGSGEQEYAYPKHVGGPNRDRVVKSNSDGYDHLGQKQQADPTDYDRLSRGSTEEEGTLQAEGATGFRNHYSFVRERTYDVVKDVKAKSGKSKFDPYSTVQDEDMEEESRLYRPSREEDPYNHIGDSDGAVSNSFIHHLRQSSDVTDPYSTVQDASGGDLKSLARGAIGGKKRSGVSSPPINDNHHDYDDTEDEDEGNDGEEEAEYAVVRKTAREHRPEGAGGPSGLRRLDDEDYGLNGAEALPPEPPRLYHPYEDEEEETYSVTSPTGEKKEHKYSKVTARESLASMSARNALNPYETVQDIPENTYATVEGGSGDGVVLRHVDSDVNNSNRNSQNSDTYAEIAISGGGLTSSVISNSSSTGGGGAAGTGNRNSSGSNAHHYQYQHNNSTVVSPVAPAPPSLDSLHLMTKSQTSSEGDRLSDRHLASPEDSGLEFMSNLPSLSPWGNRNFGDLAEDEDSGGSVAEDGYSTLRRLNESSGRNFTRPNNLGQDQGGLSPTGRRSEPVVMTDVESGETTQLTPGYTTVKDCVPGGDRAADSENDPNYESVDETRAKLRLLYKTERPGAGNDSSGHAGSSMDGRKNVTVVKVLHSVKSSTTSFSSVSQSATSSLHHSSAMPISSGGTHPSSMSGSGSKRRRRPNHDYEELDLSPPTSPSGGGARSPVASPTSPSISLAEAKERHIRNHTYEELSEVRAKSSKLRSTNGGAGQSAASTSASSSLPVTSSTSSQYQSRAETSSSSSLTQITRTSLLSSPTSASTTTTMASQSSIKPGSSTKASGANNFKSANSVNPDNGTATQVDKPDGATNNPKQGGTGNNSSSQDNSASNSDYIGTRV